MKLLRQFLKNELRISDESVYHKFQKYNELLLEWNEKINLISRKSKSIENHILNSVFFLTKYDVGKIKYLADIGTGGGFPGIPLKILFPEMKVTLIDSIRKKVNVLNDIIENMKLSDIETACGRAEEISHSKIYFKKFDTVISKSVSTLENLTNWSNDLLTGKGELLCIKGGDISDELKQLSKPELEVINFQFDRQYQIEDKKLVIIKNHSLS